MVRGRADDVTWPVQRREENIPEKKNHNTKIFSFWVSRPNFAFFFYLIAYYLFAFLNFVLVEYSATLTPTNQIFCARNPSNSAETPT